jgi:hypothetical protein
MTDQPVLNQLDLVVRDIDAWLAFCRRLGLDIPESAVWRTASGARHADLRLPNGLSPPRHRRSVVFHPSARQLRSGRRRSKTMPAPVLILAS